MARHDCPETAAVGAELLAAVAIGLATLRRHLTDPDPKVALRAVAELTKLLGVCARHGVAVEVAVEVEVVPPPVPVPVPAATDSADVPGPLRERSSFADHEPLAERAEHGKPLPGGRGAQDPSLPRPAQTLPPGGPPRLTSFLGPTLNPRPSGRVPVGG